MKLALKKTKENSWEEGGGLTHMEALTDAQELNAICLLIVSICTSFMTKKAINV